MKPKVINVLHENNYFFSQCNILYQFKEIIEVFLAEQMTFLMGHI